MVDATRLSQHMNNELMQMADPPLLVIATGQKGVGKTTFCNELREGFVEAGYHAVVFRGQRFRDYPQIDRETFFWLTVREELNMVHSIMKLGGIVILDRWMVTDLVYGGVSFEDLAFLAEKVCDLRICLPTGLDVVVAEIVAPAGKIGTRVFERDGIHLDSSIVGRKHLASLYGMASAAVAGMLCGERVIVENDMTQDIPAAAGEFIDRVRAEGSNGS